MHDYMIDALNKGKKQIPKSYKMKTQTVPWASDSELTTLHHTRVSLRKQQQNETITQKLKNVNKSIRARVKQIQNHQLREKALELNEAKQHRNIVKLWRNAKNHGTVHSGKLVSYNALG